MTRTVEVPGYTTVQEVADKLGVTGSRVRQLLKEFRDKHNRDLGFLVGRVRLLGPTDVQLLEKRHAENKH